MFSKNFYHSTGAFIVENIFSKFFSLDTLPHLAFMNWISQVLEIFNLTSSRSQLFENISDLKKILKIPLFFNLFINDLIFIIQQCTLSNYAKDNNLSISGQDNELIKSMLSSGFMIGENWFFEFKSAKMLYYVYWQSQRRKFKKL